MKIRVVARRRECTLDGMNSARKILSAKEILLRELADTMHLAGVQGKGTLAFAVCQN